MHSRLARDRYFNDFFRYISNSGQFSKTRQFIQHGDTSVYSHCVAVAYVSLWFSYRLHISVSKQSLLMGAFLHDYFLYDWHENDPSHRLHGFTHPKRALINATADWNLSDRTLLLYLQALTKSAFEMQQLLHGHNQSQYIAATFSCRSFALLYTALKAQLP